MGGDEVSPLSVSQKVGGEEQPPPPPSFERVIESLREAFPLGTSNLDPAEMAAIRGNLGTFAELTADDWLAIRAYHEVNAWPKSRGHFLTLAAETIEKARKAWRGKPGADWRRKQAVKAKAAAPPPPPPAPTGEPDDFDPLAFIAEMNDQAGRVAVDPSRIAPGLRPPANVPGDQPHTPSPADVDAALARRKSPEERESQLALYQTMP